MNTHPRNLTEWRASAGLPQHELARLAGLHKTMISHIETGRHKPSIRFARKVTDALGEHLHIKLQPADVFPGRFKRVPSADDLHGILRRLERVEKLVVYLGREIADCPECGGADETCARCYPLRAAMAKAKAVLA